MVIIQVVINSNPGGMIGYLPVCIVPGGGTMLLVSNVFYFFICLSRSESGELFVRGWQFEQFQTCHGLWVDFDIVYIMFS